MKVKLYLWSIALIFLCACSENEPEVQLNETETNVMNMQVPEECRIDEETALKNAIRHLQLTDNESKIERKVKSARRVASNSNRNEKSDNASYYYLFNFENNEGFAIASADTRDCIDVFVASPEGNLHPQEWSDLGQYSFLKELVDNYHAMKVAEANTSSRTIPNKVKRKDPYHRWEYITKLDTLINIGPLLPTRWRQDSPFNESCNGNMVGCGPLAIGQIMAYYKYPETVTVAGQQYIFDWDEMSLIRTHDDRNTSIQGMRDVADLLHAIGMQAGANYGTEYTSIYFSSVSGVFQHFGYNVLERDGFSLPVLESQLVNRTPVLMRGQPSSGGYGHMWVVDGITKFDYEEGYVDPNTHEPVESTVFEDYYYKYSYTYLWINMGEGEPRNRTLYSYESQMGTNNISLTVNSLIFQNNNSYLMMWYNISPNN